MMKKWMVLRANGRSGWRDVEADNPFMAVRATLPAGENQDLEMKAGICPLSEWVVREIHVSKDAVGEFFSLREKW